MMEEVDGGQSERGVAVCITLIGRPDRRVRGFLSTFMFRPSRASSTTDVLVSRWCGSNMYSSSGKWKVTVTKRYVMGYRIQLAPNSVYALSFSMIAQEQQEDSSYCFEQKKTISRVISRAISVC